MSQIVFIIAIVILKILNQTMREKIHITVSIGKRKVAIRTHERNVAVVSGFTVNVQSGRADKMPDTKPKIIFKKNSDIISRLCKLLVHQR